MPIAIGSITVIAWEGDDLEPPADRLSDITPPWADGHSLREEAARADIKTVRTIADVATAEGGRATARAAYRALQGTLVTVVDPWGETWENVAVMKVDTKFRKASAISGGAVEGSDSIIEATWRLLPTQPPTTA